MVRKIVRLLYFMGLDIVVILQPEARVNIGTVNKLLIRYRVKKKRDKYIKTKSYKEHDLIL